MEHNEFMYFLFWPYKDLDLHNHISNVSTSCNTQQVYEFTIDRLRCTIVKSVVDTWKGQCSIYIILAQRAVRFLVHVLGGISGSTLIMDGFPSPLSIKMDVLCIHVDDNKCFNLAIKLLPVFMQRQER